MIRKSKFVTPEFLDRIFEKVKGPWTEKYITSVSGRVAAVIVVLDPAKPVETSHQPFVLWSGILGEQDTNKWPENRPYNEFALAKARAAWRTKMHNHIMFDTHPELIQEGDFKFHGGVYAYDGIAIATSGLLTGHDDWEVSDSFATLIRAEMAKLVESAFEDRSTFYF